MKLITTLGISFFILTGCAGLPSQQEIENADYGSYPSNYSSIVKGFYSDKLKDPSSVQYRNITTPKQFYLGSRISGARYGYLVCVNYNAKNSFGAYTGYSTGGFLLRNGSVKEYLPDGKWFRQKMC